MRETYGDDLTLRLALGAIVLNKLSYPSSFDYRTYGNCRYRNRECLAFERLFEYLFEYLFECLLHIPGNWILIPLGGASSPTSSSRFAWLVSQSFPPSSPSRIGKAAFPLLPLLPLPSTWPSPPRCSASVAVASRRWRSSEDPANPQHEDPRLLPAKMKLLSSLPKPLCANHRSSMH